MRRLPGFLILYLIFLVIFTLSPFEFSMDHFRLFMHIEGSDRLRYLFVVKFYDVIANLFLFMPFGFWLRFASTQLKPDRAVTLPHAVLAGFGLSLAVELAQLFLVRSTCVTDLFSNTAGTVLGFVFINQILRLIHWFRKQLLRPFGIMITAMVLVLIGYIFLLPVHKSNLSNWNPDYPLVFYNEASEDRPWEGEIQDCIFLNKALDAEQIRLIHNNRSWKLEDSSSATFGISLSVPPNTGEKPPHTGSLGQVIAPRLMETSQLTLLLRVRTARLDQSGPARIVTQSMDPSRRNWTLGQMGKRLVFRVRTPISGRNGSRFQLITPDCILDTNWHAVAATYRRGVARIYVDGMLVPSNMNLSRNYLPAMFGLGRHPLAWYLFCFVLFIPLFFLFYHQARRFQNPVAVTGLILFGFGIELSLYFLTGQPVGGTVPFAACIIGLIGMGFSYILNPVLSLDHFFK